MARARTFYQVKRGMVFWYNPDEKVDKRSVNNTAVIQGNRPWVVVSNDDGNLTAPICNICPCTTEDKMNIPTHVRVRIKSVENTVLLEQVITVDQNKLRNYHCTLTDDTMEQIERALAKQFGIRPQIQYADYNMSNVMGRLESVIESIVKQKVEEQRQAISINQIEDTALRIGEMIEELTKPSENPPKCIFRTYYNTQSSYP